MCRIHRLHPKVFTVYLSQTFKHAKSLSLLARCHSRDMSEHCSTVRGYESSQALAIPLGGWGIRHFVTPTDLLKWSTIFYTYLMNGLIRSMIARCHSSPSLYLTATLAAGLWIAFETCCKHQCLWGGWFQITDQEILWRLEQDRPSATPPFSSMISPAN